MEHSMTSSSSMMYVVYFLSCDKSVPLNTLIGWDPLAEKPVKKEEPDMVCYTYLCFFLLV